jgi:cyclase
MKSHRFEDWTYVGDVINTAKIFNDKDVDELVVIDTQASARGSGPNLEIIEQIASECYLPTGYGGGVRSTQDALNIVKCGVDKVIINSLFLSNPSSARTISDEIGASSTVVSLDIYKTDEGYAVRNPVTGEKDKRSIESLVLDAQSHGAGELLIQSIDRDGTKSGPDLVLASELSKFTDLPLVYAGGVSSLDHASSVWRTDVDGVAAGSWFVFNGPLNAVLITYPSRRKITEAVGSL